MLSSFALLFGLTFQWKCYKPKKSYLNMKKITAKLLLIFFIDLFALCADPCYRIRNTKSTHRILNLSSLLVWSYTVLKLMRRNEATGPAAWIRDGFIVNMLLGETRYRPDCVWSCNITRVGGQNNIFTKVYSLCWIFAKHKFLHFLRIFSNMIGI